MADSQEEANQTKIFISYHHKEENLASLVKETLEVNLFSDSNVEPVYKADDNLYAGSEWLNEIRVKLSECKLCVVICSPSSLKRNWLAFECGSALRNENCKIVVFCHSGVNKDEVSSHFKTIDPNHDFPIDFIIEATSKKPLSALLKVSSDVLNMGWECDNVKPVQEDLNQNLITILSKGIPFRGKESTKPPQEYHTCQVTWVGPENAFFHEVSDENDCQAILEIDIPEEGDAKTQQEYKKLSHPEKMDETDRRANENDRLERLDIMNQLLVDGFCSDDKVSINTGVAIGIQNCLFDNDTGDLFVGVRFKSNVDATNSGTSLSKGEFHTGYKLIRNGDEHKERAKSVGTLEDLFNASTTLKSSVMPIAKKYLSSDKPSRERMSNEVYEKINTRLELFGTRLFKIRLPKKIDGSSEFAYASLFINNSTWFPRFEIGVWKFIDITGYKEKISREKPFINGFGEDVFQDYRGNVEDPASEINFWVWVKEGEIEFRSYPEERYIPRKKPVRHMCSESHSVILSSDVLSTNYGINDRLTQFVADERLQRDAFDQIIRTQCGQPATRLLTWF